MKRNGRSQSGRREKEILEIGAAIATKDIRSRVIAVYEGSDGDATKAFYADLERCGPIGIVAVNLFLAQKCSSRAKAYRGGNGNGSYRSQAYDRKSWSIDNLCTVLAEHAEALGILWGWGIDSAKSLEDPFRHVLYIETPHGQVSFHNRGRGSGPDRIKPWDGVDGMVPSRVCTFVAAVLGAEEGR